eukprot:1695404-Rhodomonas_salina.1
MQERRKRKRNEATKQRSNEATEQQTKQNKQEEAHGRGTRPVVALEVLALAVVLEWDALGALEAWHVGAVVEERGSRHQQQHLRHDLPPRTPARASLVSSRHPTTTAEF